MLLTKNELLGLCNVQTEIYHGLPKTGSVAAFFEKGHSNTSLYDRLHKTSRLQIYKEIPLTQEEMGSLVLAIDAISTRLPSDLALSIHCGFFHHELKAIQSRFKMMKTVLLTEDELEQLCSALNEIHHNDSFKIGAVAEFLEVRNPFYERIREAVDVRVYKEVPLTRGEIKTLALAIDVIFKEFPVGDPELHTRIGLYRDELTALQKRLLELSSKTDRECKKQ